MTTVQKRVGYLSFIVGCSMCFGISPSNASPFRADGSYFDFGRIFRADKPKTLDQTSPHQIAQYSVFECKEGRTDQLVKAIRPVEKDKKLGESFQTFISEFGPDLEVFKGKSLYLKFSGYDPGKDVSVWYYSLVDAKGKNLINSSWVSVHRSKLKGKCVLTGIFLNSSKNTPAVPLPKGLKSSR